MKFSTKMSQAQCQQYFDIFQRHLVMAVAQSLNVFKQFAKVNILTGYEQYSSDVIGEKYQAAMEKHRLNQEQLDKDMGEFMAQSEMQKQLIQERVKLLLEYSALKAQNDFMSKIKNDIALANHMMEQFTEDKTKVQDNIRDRKANQVKMIDMNAKIEQLLQAE